MGLRDPCNIHLIVCLIRYRSIITSFYTRVHVWKHDKYLNNPITWLRRPCFLMAWNIHVLCNLSCATRGIITPGTATHVIAMNGTCVGTNVQLTFDIHQQLTYKNMSNSVHNCESCSRKNYQGDRLIAHV